MTNLEPNAQTLKIHFDNQQTLYYFAVWLNEHGVAIYHQYMEEMEGGYEGQITAVGFDFNVGGDFIRVNEIGTVSGRIND
jgi:hypothetical protein